MATPEWTDELETIEVRTCRVCKVIKERTKFDNSHVCFACGYERTHTLHRVPLFRGRQATARGIVITPAGRELLAEWRAEEAAAVA